MSDKLTTPLVVGAWEKAWQKSKPRGLLHHSDCGGQYASQRCRDVLHQSGATASTSAAGYCCDNAAMESFWTTLKAAVAPEWRRVMFSCGGGLVVPALMEAGYVLFHV